MASKISGSRPRIGIFFSEFGGYQEAILTGAIHYAQNNDVSLFCFPGGAVNDITGDFKMGNVIYNLATPRNLDGLILLTGTLGNYVSQEEMLRFCANFASIPLITAGTSLPGLPSLTIDNTAGLRAVMSHLIEAHHFNRIAFIRGPEENEEAQMRYAIYREALDTYGIPFDESLVAPGTFLPDAGTAAISLLLDERKVSFQAIVASNDNMALGALTELIRRGYHVPQDFAVTGFDDIAEAQTSVIPLTTVRQTLGEMGAQSVAMMLEYARSGTMPEHKALPTELVIRESCGCLSLVTASVTAYKSEFPARSGISGQDQAHFLSLVQNRVGERFPRIESSRLAQLIGSFIDQVEGHSDQFLNTFVSLLRTSTDQAEGDVLLNRQFDVWQDVVSILRSVVLPRCNRQITADQVEDLLHQGRALVTEAMTRAVLGRIYMEGQLSLLQNGVIRNLGMTTTLPQIADVIAEGLPQLGIHSCYLALHLGQLSAETQAQQILAFDAHGRAGLDPDGLLFKADQLIAPEVMPENPPSALMVRALWAGDMRLGFILMALEPGIRSMYETHQELARHISTAIRSVLMRLQIAESNERLAERADELARANAQLEALNVELEVAQRRAEQASNAKSVFLSNMSHELRTPLNVIIGYSNSMLNMPQMFGNVQLPENYRQYLHLIEENGHYLVGLINDILDLSKIEAGRLELHHAVVSLPEIMHGVVSTSIGLLKEKPIQIRPEFPEDLPHVWADPKRVRQILLNLMSNAIKFTDTGSVILRARHDDGRISISVVDTGIGIPEDVIPVIFDRFQQAQGDTDKKYGGTGLGLDISKQLCQMHGGDLVVDSEMGKGSTFTFTLPLATPQQLEGEPISAYAETHESASMLLDPAKYKTLERHSVLIIEDEVSMRDMMRNILESVGHVVTDTNDGTQGMDLAMGLIPDLIILDIFLPNVDGWEVLRELKKCPDTAAIPVVVCTIAQDSHKAADLGAALYLEKPVTPEKILDAVAQIFASDQPISE